MSACLASAMDYLHNRCKRQRTSAKTARAVLVEQGLLVSLSFVKRDGDSVLFCLFPLFSTFAASFSTFVSFSPSPHLTNVTIGTLSSMWTITFPFSPLVLTLFSPFYRKLITLFSPYRKLVHGDLTPSNVMVCQHGDSKQVKITDFGLLEVGLIMIMMIAMVKVMMRMTVGMAD